MQKRAYMGPTMAMLATASIAAADSENENLEDVESCKEPEPTTAETVQESRQVRRARERAEAKAKKAFLKQEERREINEHLAAQKRTHKRFYRDELMIKPYKNER